MSHQDWEPVILRKKPKSDAERAAELKKDPSLGISVTKANAGTNKQHKPGQLGGKQVRDPVGDGDEPAKPKKVYTVEFRKQMQQARQEKGWSQKDLATKINVKQTVIADIESGKEPWDGSIVTKIERVLGSLRK